MNTTLPTDSGERKNVPMLRGVLRYFPAALAGVAVISKKGNDKHNPGEEMHHARGKSNDHGDCIIRHLMDIQDLEARQARDVSIAEDHYAREILEEAGQLCWRALALSQELHEKYGNAPLAPGARLPKTATEIMLTTSLTRGEAAARWPSPETPLGEARTDWVVKGQSLRTVEDQRPDCAQCGAKYGVMHSVDCGFYAGGPLENADTPFGNGY